MKNICFGVFIFTFLLFSSTFVFAGSFTDLPENHWSYWYVEDLVSRGIINGYKDGTFRPSNQITRGEFLKLLISSYDENNNIKSSASGEEHWAKPYFDEAINNGYMYIENKGRDLDEKINRLEVVMVLEPFCQKYKISNPEKTQVPNFNDTSNLGDLEIEKLNYLVENGLLKGYDENLFKPYNTITRAEIATILFRLRELNKN